MIISGRISNWPYQHCGEDRKDTGEIFIDIMAIRANADAIRLLVRHGIMEIDSEVGRRVRARWTAAGQKLNDNRPFKNTLQPPLKWKEWKEFFE